MARSRYLPDRGLTARMGLTMFLLGLLYVALIVVVTSYTNLVLGLLIAGGALFAQWFFSDRIALYAMHGRVVTPEEAPQLHGIVDRLCALSDMPKPTVANALGTSVSAIATVGFGMSDRAHKRSTMPCSCGASSGVTTRPCIA